MVLFGLSGPLYGKPQKTLLRHGLYQNFHVNGTAWTFSCTICVDRAGDELGYPTVAAERGRAGLRGVRLQGKGGLGNVGLGTRGWLGVMGRDSCCRARWCGWRRQTWAWAWRVGWMGHDGTAQGEHSQQRWLIILVLLDFVSGDLALTGF